MVFCTYCGHSFTRDEHLERHILTHTNVKPFKCFTCHMSFARRDLLQRHYTVHGKTPDQQEIPAANGMLLKSAGRTPIACSNCAKTKTKCDKKFPCTRCATRNLKCTLRPTRRSTKNAARMGLITPETLAAGLVGIAPEGHAVAAAAAENVNEDDVDDADDHAHEDDDCDSSPSVLPMSVTSRPSNTSSSCSSTHRDASPDSGLDVASDSKPGSTTPPIGLCTSPITPPLGPDFCNPFTPHQDLSGSKKGDAQASPRFMLDWQQLQLPMDYDPMVHPDFLGNSDLNLDLSSMALDSQLDPALVCYTDLSPPMTGSFVTPMETPLVEHVMPDFTPNSGIAVSHDRNQSLISTYTSDTFSDISHGHPSLANIDPVLIAQASWNAFRCVPGEPLITCPTTARWNLEALESSLKDHDGWSNWTPELSNLGNSDVDKLSVMKLHESTRDKLLAITQGFLHKALEIHRGSTLTPNMSSYALSNFVLLPPAKVLEFFLRSYSNSFERYYKITSRSTLDTNELMHCYNDKASSLLVLLMVAESAMSIPSIEARALTLGLIEACRISLFDLIERNVHMASERNVLHAALIFTSVAAWGGDKWQMDIAMGQRAIYMSMLRHSGMLQGAIPMNSMTQDGQNGKDQLWNQWIGQESHSRLVYAWAMIDQELALFHDTAPVLSVTEFAVRLPHSDDIWQAKTAGEWSSAMRSIASSSMEPIHPLTLRDLFRQFLDDELDTLTYPLTSTHIRLLLHPLQSMTSHYTGLLSCFTSPSAPSSRSRTKSMTASSTRCRIEELQSLLQRWFVLATTHAKTHPTDPALQTAFVLHHLISLNTCTSFAAIEQLARRESFDGTYASLVRAHRRSIADVNEALFHCGQVLRLVRAMPRANRPAWWPAAIYRAGLVLWCDSLINKDGSASSTSAGGKPEVQVAIDALGPEDQVLQRYLNKGEGTPCLTSLQGENVGIEHGGSVLEYCIGVLDEGIPTRFQEGIRAKLDVLMRS